MTMIQKQKDRVSTTSVIARCEATWQSVLFRSPLGTGRCFASQGMRIATSGFALAMTQ